MFKSKFELNLFLQFRFFRHLQSIKGINERNVDLMTLLSILEGTFAMI